MLSLRWTSTRSAAIVALRPCGGHSVPLAPRQARPVGVVTTRYVAVVQALRPHFIGSAATERKAICGESDGRCDGWRRLRYDPAKSRMFETAITTLVSKGHVVILKVLERPASSEFATLMAHARRAAKAAGLTSADVTRATPKARRAR